jgi:hypothetical protein
MKNILIAHDEKWCATLHLRCDDKDYIRRVMTHLEKYHLAKDGWRFKVVDRSAGTTDERDEE